MGKDLRSFLELVRQKIPEDFLQIEEEIGTQYETTAWVKSYEREGKHPIIFFTRVKGFNRPIVSNLFGSRKGMPLLGADPMLKHIVIVDKDIDLFNEREVLWAIATRVQADRDIHIIPNCSGSDLDPSTQYPPGNEGKTAKMIVNATAKPSLNYEAYSRKNHIPKEVENKIKDKIFGDPSGRGYSI